MIHIPKKKGKTPIHPYWEKSGDEVHIVCANGHRSKLVEHAVLENGSVVPHIKCPIKGCKFQGEAFLNSWVERYKDNAK